MHLVQYHALRHRLRDQPLGRRLQCHVQYCVHLLTGIVHVLADGTCLLTGELLCVQGGELWVVGDHLIGQAVRATTTSFSC